MKFYVSTYNKKNQLFICKINQNGIISILNSKNFFRKIPYMYRKKDKISIALKMSNNEKNAGIAIMDKELNIEKTYLQEESYTHIYNGKKYIIAASYHQGCILILNKENKKIIKKKYESSKIHNVGKIYGNKFYAIDLLNSVVYFFKIINDKFISTESITLEHRIQPRHLVSTNRGKNLYIISENTSEVLVYIKQNSQFKNVQRISTLVKKDKKISIWLLL